MGSTKLTMTSKLQNYPFPVAKIKEINRRVIKIDANFYRIIDNYHQALNLAVLRRRYSPFFTKFDYILGDVSGEQLRLTGFYEFSKNKKQRLVATCADFLAEFGTFDCPYFLLKKIQANDEINA